MKNIIIFGGAGFIGTNLTIRLLQEGNKIICVDNLYTGRFNNIKNFINNSSYYFFKADITNYQTYLDLKEIIEDFFYNFVDEIYNFACPASPDKYQKDPIFTIHCSTAVEYMCELAMFFNCPILHSSTSEVYGNPDINHHPQDETYNGNVHTIGPRSCYDEGKRIAETILYEYHNKGCNTKIVRIFNTYGPYMDPNDGRVISNFICQALLNKDITIYGDGSQNRSFQYIDDLIDGIISFMRNTSVYEMGPVNIGNPDQYTIHELAYEIFKLISSSTSQIIYKKLPKDDPIQRKPNITKAKKLFNYCPKTNLQTGLEKTIKYFKKELYETEFKY